MSNTTKQTEQDCHVAQGGDVVELVITPQNKDLGGFSVRRSLPAAACRSVGPWVFFDHMGPARFPAGEGINVRPHPHVNMATVTYLFEGEILHRDSLGSLQAIHPGDINLMVAGSGIVHSERERPEVRAVPHTQHGLQLWLALPEADEEMAPVFYHYPAGSLPTVDVDGIPVRVMMGSAYGVTSPVRVFADTLYLDAQLQPGQTLRLPAAQARAVYVVQGAVKVKDMPLAEHSLAVLRSGAEVVLEAIQDSRITLIGGEPLGPRFLDWNFVSSRRERLAQARQDWENGRFPKVPGDEVEFIPLPE